MHWKIQCGATRGAVTVAFAVMMLVPSARPDDAPKKGESTCVGHENGKTDESPVGCQGSQNNEAAQMSIEKE